MRPLAFRVILYTGWFYVCAFYAVTSCVRANNQAIEAGQ